MAQYRINENFMGQLETKMKRLERKCNKLGCSFTYREVGEEFETVKKADGSELTTRYVLVEAEGTAVVNGWEFAASIEHTGNGNVIDKALTDVEVPRRYWTSDTYCEHCKTRRQRKYVYLVRNTETGEFKQVGHNCLMDYTNGMSAQAVAAYMELKRALEEEQGRAFDGCGGDYRRWTETDRALTLAFGAVRAFGYKKSDEIGSTRGSVWEYLDVNKPAFSRQEQKHKREIREEMERHNISDDNEQDRADALAALEWLKAQDEETDYMHNMRTVCLGEYIDLTRLGLLVSLVPTWSKAMDREIKRREREEHAAEEAKVSSYVGEVGERITADISGFRVLTSWYTQFGDMMLYKFTDPDGNVLIWKTGNYVDDTYKTITGTVKEHSEFNGVKQTVLTRCKVSK